MTAHELVRLFPPTRPGRPPRPRTTRKKLFHETHRWLPGLRPSAPNAQVPSASLGVPAPSDQTSTPRERRADAPSGRAPRRTDGRPSGGSLRARHTRRAAARVGPRQSLPAGRFARTPAGWRRRLTRVGGWPTRTCSPHVLFLTPSSSSGDVRLLSACQVCLNPNLELDLRIGRATVPVSQLQELC
jgi:hypothetical protein